jgi:hypothetical protein
MELDHSWGDGSHSARKEIPPMLCIPKVHYLLQNSPLLNTLHPISRRSILVFFPSIAITCYLFRSSYPTKILCELHVSPILASICYHSKVTWHEMDGWSSIPGIGSDFSLRYCVQTASGARRVAY